MSEEEKDKLIDDIVEVTRQCCDDFNEGLADRLAEQLVEKLVKKLTIPFVVGSYSQEEIEAAYDKGLEDGYACMPSNL